jgi:hypothetical protein
MHHQPPKLTMVEHHNHKVFPLHTSSILHGAHVMAHCKFAMLLKMQNNVYEVQTKNKSGIFAIKVEGVNKEGPVFVSVPKIDVCLSFIIINNSV